MSKRSWKGLPGTFGERQLASSDVLCACGCSGFISGRAKRAKEKGLTEGYIKGHTWKGKSLPESAKEKMRTNHADVSGEKNPNFGKGLHGEDNPNWQGGKKRNFYKGGNQPEAARKHDREFRRRIIDRDKACVLCGNETRLLVHHIESWVDRKDLRQDETNCVTLCIRCHGRADNAHHKDLVKPMLLAYIETLRST